jgi:RNase adapter protein RapZ
MNGIMVVTGMSGAGRSSVLRILEDLGCDAVDNLPFALLKSIVAPGASLPAPLAVGIDSRSRGLIPGELIAHVARFRAACEAPITLLFMDCDDEILRRRYTETRRRHPMAADRPVTDGIAREREFLSPLRAAADYVFDTTSTSLGDLRRWVTTQFGGDRPMALNISILSFAYRNGLPREADLVFDLRFLRNPHYVEALRRKTGLDPDVQAYVLEDPDFLPTLDRLSELILPLLPRYAAEGKSYLTIAIGCTGGQHRSVFAVERLHATLEHQGWHTTVIHRDMPRNIAAQHRPS